MTTHSPAPTGYRALATAGIHARVHAQWERVASLEARTTANFWEHADFAELGKLRAAVGAAHRAMNEAGTASELEDLGFEALANEYEHELVHALAAAQDIQLAAEGTFGQLPDSPRCSQTSASWFARLFAHPVPDQDLAELTANFDKFLHRMDATATRTTVGRGVYVAQLCMREVPILLSVRWETLEHEQLWRISVPTRIGLRPFSVTPLFFATESAAELADSPKQARELANENPYNHDNSVPTAADYGLNQAQEFGALLRITGNQDAAQRVLNFDVRGYLIALLKATTPALVVGEGRATIAFAQTLTEDLLKYSLRILMAAHAAPAELQLLR